MPAEHGLGLHEDESGPPLPPGVGEQHPEHAIARAQMRSSSALYGPQLLPQGDILEHEVVVSAAGRHERAYD
jgi:hypothetical protein